MKETKIFLTDEEDKLLEQLSNENGQSKTKFCTIEIRKILIALEKQKRAGKKNNKITPTEQDSE